MMNIGALRHIINIENRSTADVNADGDRLQSWQTLYSDIPAEIKANPSVETFVGSGVQTQGAYTVCLRYLPSIDSTCRIVFKGRYFNIISIDNVLERDIELQIQVKEEVVPQ